MQISLVPQVHLDQVRQIAEPELVNHMFFQLVQRFDLLHVNADVHSDRRIIGRSIEITSKF